MISDVRVADDAPRLTAQLVADALRRAVDVRGAATVAFSGGDTAPPMLRALATMDVPWEHLQVFQVDERVAPDGHEDRNVEALALLPLPAGALHAMPVTLDDLHLAAADYAARLPERLDVVHLGMGADGHTASWPPGHPIMDATAAVEVCPEFNGRRRLTLTPLAVNAGLERIVLIMGADKAAPVRRWLDGDGNLPIARVRTANTVVVLDGPAGSEVIERATSVAGPDAAADR